MQSGKAPKLYLRATHEKTLALFTDADKGLELLKSFAVDLEEAEAELEAVSRMRAELSAGFRTVEEGAGPPVES